MRVRFLGSLIACAALAALPLLMATNSGAQAPAPPANPMPIMPPQLPPAHVVDLMTDSGVAIFGAQWKNMDVRNRRSAAARGRRPEMDLVL